MTGLEGSTKSNIVNLLRAYSLNDMTKQEVLGQYFEILYLKESEVCLCPSAKGYVTLHHCDICSNQWEKYINDLFGFIWIMDTLQGTRFTKSRKEFHKMLDQIKKNKKKRT